MTKSNELKPIEPPFPAEVSEILALYPQQDGYLLSLFRTFANSKRFLLKGVPNLLDKESPLSLREREIAILRITAVRGCEYEWGVHVAIFAKAAGLSEQQVVATRLGKADDPIWSSEDALLLEAVDALVLDGAMSEALRNRFQTALSVEKQLEIVALCGAYQTVSMVARLAQLPLEQFSARFPDRL